MGGRCIIITDRKGTITKIFKIAPINQHVQISSHHLANTRTGFFVVRIINQLTKQEEGVGATKKNTIRERKRVKINAQLNNDTNGSTTTNNHTN